MTLKDDVATKLQHDKQILIRKYDRNEMSKKEFEKEYEELDKEIRERNQVVMDKYKNQEINNTGNIKMEEQTKEVKKEKLKVARVPKKESYAAYIEKVLCMEDIKTIEEAITKVTELKPGKDASSLKRMIRVIIKEVQKQKQLRWLNYTWNEEQYLLTAPVKE